MEHHEKEETIFDKHRENIYFRWGMTAFVVIVACILVAQLVTKLPAFLAFVKTFLKALSPVVYGLVIAYLLHPIVDRVQNLLQPRLEKRVKKPGRAESIARGTGILLALVFGCLVIWALIAMILPQLLDSIVTIVGNLPDYYNTLSTWVMNVIDDTPALASVTEGLMEQFYDYLENFLNNTLLPKLQTAIVTLTTSVVGLAKVLLNLVIGVIISVYLLTGKDKLLAQSKKIIYALLGRTKGGYVLNVCTFANRAAGGFIGGKIVDSAIIGLLCFVGLAIMKMPYALLISIFVGVTNIIPFFGPFIGAIPSALLLLVIDPMQCIYFVIFVVVLQQLDGNVIGPLILSDATGLSSIWIVVSILIFSSLWGVVGMIVAVPLFAVIYKIVTEVVNWSLTNRGLSTDTAEYEKWNYPPRKNYDHWNPVSRRSKKKILRKLKKTEGTPTEETETAGETGDNTSENT